MTSDRTPLGVLPENVLLAHRLCLHITLLFVVLTVYIHILFVGSKIIEYSTRYTKFDAFSNV